MGFRVFRVRHHLDGVKGPLPRARVQIAPAEMAGRLDEHEAGRLREGLLAVGYRDVEIDPEGYRSALS